MFQKQILSLFSTILVFLFSLYTISLISLFLKIPISQIQFVISIIFTYAYTIIFTQKIGIPSFVKVGSQIFAIFAGILCFCMLFGSITHDFSFDGQGYHAAGTIAMEKGWNPFYENFDLNKTIKTENSLWVQAYPHTNTIWTLNLYKITGNVETGKAINLLLIIMASLISFIALSLLGLNRWQNLLLVTLITINPINTLQIFTFGLDTQFYSLLVVLISLGVMIYHKYYLKISLFYLFILTVLLINNKLTSIAYFGLFSAIYCIFLLISKKWKLLIQTVIVLLFSSIIALTVFGFQPFVTNQMNHRSPFYPIYISKDTGDKQYNFFENRPSNYINENQVLLFFKAIFFKTNGNFAAPKDVAQFKIPFSISKSESESFKYLGPKAGGMGVFFSGILVLCVILLMYLTLLRKKFLDSKLFIIGVIALFTTLILSCISNPLNNSFRYVPQIWLIIPLILFFSWKFKSYIVTGVTILIGLLTLVNSYFVITSTTIYNYTSAIELNAYLIKLSKISKTQQLKVNFAQAEGNEFLLNKYNVNYKADLNNSNSFNCGDGFQKLSLLNNIGNSTALICLTSQNIEDLK